jgi:hypothetical protein
MASLCVFLLFIPIDDHCNEKKEDFLSDKIKTNGLCLTLSFIFGNCCSFEVLEFNFLEKYFVHLLLFRDAAASSLYKILTNQPNHELFNCTNHPSET